MSSREAVNANLSGFWFDQIENRPMVYRFSSTLSTRSIRLVTDWLNPVCKPSNSSNSFEGYADLNVQILAHCCFFFHILRSAYEMNVIVTTIC